MTAAYHQYLFLAIQADHPQATSVLGYFIQCTINKGRYKKMIKTWENMIKCARSWEIGLKVEKVCYKMRKSAKSWESTYEKVWESVLKVEKVR